MTSKPTFAPADYAVFGLMLAFSALIGIFYAIKDRRSKAGIEGYLLASRSMGVFPVATSLTVSFMSAITVLGTPAEVYLYGTMFWWMVVAFLIVAVIVSQVYIPMFYKLGITSTYEYLEKRFNRAVRILSTIAYLIQSVMYMGIVIYGPALALNEVTGFNLWMAVTTTGLVCTFYTTLGGLKAVLWTDVFQGFIMCAGFIAVIIRGSVLNGGFGNIWKICEDGGRIDFVHFDTDMRVRHSFWSLMTGGTVTWVGLYGVNQSQVQRYLCCKSAKKATQALFLNVFGLFIVVGLACMTGLVIYAQYSTCDPLKQGCVGASDQLFPYLVMDILNGYPGVPGLFVACVFSGSLSTVSSGINAMATVTIEDFIKPCCKKTDRAYTWITKGLVLIYGVASIGMAVLASFLGSILEAAYSILGIIGGPLVGLFTLAIFLPFANSIGAFVGTLFGLAMATWIYAGSRTYRPGVEFTRKLHLTTSGCNSSCYGFDNITSTQPEMTTLVPTAYEFNTSTVVTEAPAIAQFYTVSYLYIAVIGLATTVAVGVIVSLITCGWKHRREVDPQLLSPFFDHRIFKWLPHKFRYVMRCCVREKRRRVVTDDKEIERISISQSREKPLPNVRGDMGGYENKMDGIVEDDPNRG